MRTVIILWAPEFLQVVLEPPSPFNAEELERLFVEVLKLCREAGFLKVGIVALDGTKLKANAALSANRTYEHIEVEVKKMLSEAAAKDVEEAALYGKEKRGDELPEELRDRKSRLGWLRECKRRSEQEAAEGEATGQKTG